MRGFVTSILILCSVVCSAQTLMNKDSLLAILPTAQNDTNKVFLYINIGQQYEANQPDSAKYYYLKARDLSEALNFTLGKIKFISNFTYVLDMQGMFDSSLQLNLHAIELAKQLNNNKHLAATYGNVGASLQRMQRYDEAVKYYVNSLRYGEKTRDKIYLSVINNNITAIYNSLGQYEKALMHAQTAVQYARETNSLFNLGQGLNNLGIALTNLKRSRDAIKTFEEALVITKKIEDDFSYATNLISLSTLYLEIGELEKVKKCTDESLAIFRTLNDTEGIAISLRSLGHYYLFHNDFIKSKQFAIESLNTARDAKNQTEEYKALELLSDIAMADHDFVEMEAYRSAADSVQNLLQQETILAKINEYTIQYESEKKDNAIKLQQAEIRSKNTWNYILIGSLIALFIIIILGYRNYRHHRNLQRQRINELEREKKLSATEAILKGEEQERTRLAKDLHDGLGGMLSRVRYSFSTIKGNMVMSEDNAMLFERSLNLIDSSIREMRRVAHNMMPEVLVNAGLDTALSNFCEEVNKSGALAIRYQSINVKGIALDQTVSITVYRIVQELINNIIKHADAKSAIVQVSKSHKQLQVTVEDDGKGFDTNLLKHSTGLGWRSVKNRVEFLKGTMDVTSQLNVGTSVLIELTVD